MLFLVCDIEVVMGGRVCMGTGISKVLGLIYSEEFSGEFRIVVGLPKGTA